VGRVFQRMRVVVRVLFFLFFVRFRHGGLDGGGIGQGYGRQRLAGVGLGAPVLRVLMLIAGVVMLMVVCMIMTFMIVIMTLMIVLPGIGVVMLGVGAEVFRVLLLAVNRLGDLRRFGACAFDDLALDSLAIAAAARVAVARATPAAGAILGLFFGLAMGALVRLDQRLAIGDRYLIIVGMDFAEGEEAVAVTAIFDEGGLQRRLYARDLGEVDIAAQLFALRGLEIKFFDAIAADHNDPGLFRVGGIDQHFVGHFGTLDGGGRVSRQARIAPPGDATVHLIRG